VRKGHGLSLNHQMITHELGQVGEGAIEVTPCIVLVHIAPKETRQHRARLGAPGDGQIVQERVRFGRTKFTQPLSCPMQFRITQER